MMNVHVVASWVKGVSAAVGAVLAFMFGELRGIFVALVIFMILDYITGVIAAYCEKKLSSRIGARGIAKKVALLVIVVLAHMIDAHVIGNGDVLRSAVIFFYLSNEGLSILENSIRIGLPVPKKLKAALVQMRDKEGGK